MIENARWIAPMEEGINGLELGNAMLMSGLLKKEVLLPLDSAVYAEMLAGLVKNSNYGKKTVREADNSSFSSSH